LRQGKVLGDRIDAGRVGGHLATTHNFQNMDADGILTALGGAWAEPTGIIPRLSAKHLPELVLIQM
jgi:hypothetical protein